MSVAVDLDRPSSRGRSAERAWCIPPLVRGAGGELPEGFRIGARTVAHLRGTEACCEVYLVTHEDGSSCMARVARRQALVERPGLAEAMLASAKRLAGLRHPNLLAVKGCGLTDEPSPRPYVLHERVVGRDLASYQARHGCVEPALLLAIGIQCAAALEALHEVGLAHAELWRGCAVLVPVGGDSFEIKLGGFEHMQVIRPGATADEEPRVAAELAALAAMLAELAEDVEDVPPALVELIARMTAGDPELASASAVKAAITAIRAQIDPGASVIAAEPEPVIPQRLAGASGRWGQKEPEFGQMTLVMPRERPVAPIRLASTAWLTLAIVVASAIGVLLAAALGGRSVVGAIEARRLAVGREEPAPALAVPRTVPERVAEALPAAPRVAEALPVATEPARGETARPAVGAREPCVAAVEAEPEVRSSARRAVASPRGKPASETAPVEVVELPPTPPVEASEPPPMLSAPRKPEVPVEDGLGLLPVGGGSKADGGAGPFLVTAS